MFGHGSGKSNSDKAWVVQREQSKIMWQFIVKWALWIVGTLYIFIEKFRNYPNEERDNILGLKIDKDLQTMSRFNLCSYMDTGFPRKGFWELNSTTKIRLGAQLMRNILLSKKKKAPRKKISKLKKKE
tara:strand:+ start:78 stop:461 length:384 start_codon:yes stop_codon:yes gene_type:complete